MAVHTDVRIGAVALTGHVRTWSEYAAVIDAVRRGVGVKHVRDYVVVLG